MHEVSIAARPSDGLSELTDPDDLRVFQRVLAEAVTGLVPVDVTAADNVGVARVELYANNVLKGTDTIAPYGFTLDAAQYTDGPVNLQARAYDATGKSASSSTVTVTVANDTTAPKVTITNPAYGSVVSGTVSINVAATDNQRVAKIVLSIDGQQVAVTYGASLSYNWTVTTTRKGGRKQSSTTSTIVARAEDPAGNAATATATVTKQ